MRLIQGYIFRRVVRAFLLSLAALSTTVWLTQALRQFDLVSAMGQTLLTFFELTLLLLPGLTTVVAPVALMIAVIYTFNTMNEGSELVVINAAGTRQWWMLKPVLIAAVGVSIFMAAMTLHFSPLSLRLWRELITDVHSNLLTSILKEGEFIELEQGLSFQLRQRAADGTLRGIFLADSRDDEETVQYLAERGNLLDTPLGMFLVMRDGTIQTQKSEDKSISIIQFTSYAFDLSTFSSPSKSPPIKPQERPTAYLFNPDPGDRYFQRTPGRFTAEIHTRFTTPLNALVFALIPLAFLSQAETTRQRRSATIALAVATATGIAALEFVLSIAAREYMIAGIAMYVLPVAAIGASIALILLGIQPRAPEAMLIAAERVAGGLRGLFRRSRAAATAEG
jgi:lipopolysaccharide export system permease protein